MTTEILPSPLLTVEGVCTYLGVSKDYVYDEVRGGRLRAAKFARQLRFRQCDVEDFIDHNLVGAEAM